MGCINSRDHWIAKESFHPSEDLKIDDGNNLLKINKDDKLKMLDDHTFSEKDMYKMKNLISKEIGLVSKMFVAKAGTIECEPWYFGPINRRKAVDLLQAENNVKGSFLVRDSDQFKGDYSLSVKTWDDKSEAFVYKHYRIRHIDDRFYITESHQYSSLSELVKTCQENAQKGLACKLTNVCLKPSWNKPETKWNIPRSEIKLDDKKLGSGNFGSVYKGSYRGVTDVAVKQLHNLEENEGMSLKAKNEFMDEAKILKTLQHPNLVQVLGVCIDSDPYLMVLEYLENGDLKSFLQKNGREKTTFDKLLLICEDIASGMRELAKLEIVHRDLAARNIMLDKWYQAKVGDFGLAREGGEYSNAKTKFPVRWTAPEALKFKKFTLQSDVWSFGIVLWEIFTFGQMPYSNISSNSEILTQLDDKGYRMPPPKYDGTTEKNVLLIHKMMLACWQAEPNSRPKMQKLYKDLSLFGSDDMEAAYEEYRYVKKNTTTDRRRDVMDQRSKADPKRKQKPQK